MTTTSTSIINNPADTECGMKWIDEHELDRLGATEAFNQNYAVVKTANGTYFKLKAAFIDGIFDAFLYGEVLHEAEVKGIAKAQ